MILQPKLKVQRVQKRETDVDIKLQKPNGYMTDRGNTVQNKYIQQKTCHPQSAKQENKNKKCNKDSCFKLVLLKVEGPKRKKLKLSQQRLYKYEKTDTN